MSDPFLLKILIFKFDVYDEFVYTIYTWNFNIPYATTTLFQVQKGLIFFILLRNVKKVIMILGNIVLWINPLNPELNPICYLLAIFELIIFSTLAG